MRFPYQNPKLLWKGKRFGVYHVDQSLEGKTIPRELVDHPGAVVILPLLDDDTILLIQNERFSVGGTLLELPAGTLEIGEEPLSCAHRELKEETGYKSGALKPLLEFFPSPGYCNEILFAFEAHDLTFVGMHLEETERIEVMPVSWKEALTLIREGTIRDAKTICTLLYYNNFSLKKMEL